jgi:ribonuclease E
VVIDFIEMKEGRHCREVEKTLRNALKMDKARTTVGRISRFGLLEMVRQRMGSTALSTTLEECPVCQGAGRVRNLEWQALQALKDIYHRLCDKGGVEPLEYSVGPKLAEYMLNQKRGKLVELEEQFERRVVVTANGC